MREDLWIIVTATCRDRVGRWSRYWCQWDEAAENPHECRQEICPVLAAAEGVMVKQAEIAGEAAGDALALHLKSTRARPS